MTTTEKLLRVHRVDKMLRSLTGRLAGAERFLAEQVRALGDLEAKDRALDQQLRQLQASAADAEGEAARVGARIEALREQMNTATSNKEYKAFLTELATYKDQKGAQETRALELMEQAEKVKAQRGEVAAGVAERRALRDRAAAERAEREAEIAGRLSELQAERATLAQQVPAEAMRTYAELVARLDEEAMAPIEIQDRKRHEFTCGSCMMSLPVESMSALLSHGSITRCVSCGCILYLEETSREAMSAKK